MLLNYNLYWSLDQSKIKYPNLKILYVSLLLEINYPNNRIKKKLL